MAISSQRPLELWGGIECTTNRVGDRFFSQLEQSGHLTRLDDLDRIATLGIRTLRHPVLWEHLAPQSLHQIDWSWPDERLGKLRDLGIRPIVGLVHHGSGPRYTSLLDPQFPAKLAKFARAVAQRYPWIDAFTPINEPLTTARFSGLYGHWYPHAHDEWTFTRCLLTQLRGVVLAMRAIREVNPSAQLIQTDDLGKTFSSARLQYQADFENERRWIGWDLLCGRVHSDHRMFHHLRWVGVPSAEIEWFAANPCPPDIVGINYYITSERFLDENWRTYPMEPSDGNGRDRYADVAAVRARPEGVAGAKTLIAEASGRYALPVAITEAHIGCSRVEQLRWFMEIWESAKALNRLGVDVRAVTSWSLLGAQNWDTLLTSDAGSYESGAFDLRGESARPTAIARMIRQLATGLDFRHPVLSVPGWWHRPIRFIPRVAPAEEPFVQSDTRPLLIIEVAGGIAEGFAYGAMERGLPARIARDETGIDRLVEETKPWAVIDCKLSTQSPEIAATCAALSIPFAVLSSAAVFRGTKTAAYVESDQPDAVEENGSALAERDLVGRNPAALLVRTGEIFGTGGPHDFVATITFALADGKPLHQTDDALFSTAYLPDLVAAVLDLVVDEESGHWHLAHTGAQTHFGLAKMIAEISGVEAVIEPIRSEVLLSRVLATTRGGLLPPLHSALRHYVESITGDVPVATVGAACL